MAHILIEEGVPLHALTTIGLGGEAKVLIRCGSVEEIQQALAYAREHNMPWHVLGGGSNTVFADEGFDGLIIKIELMGCEWGYQGQVGVVRVAAGEVWDDVVAESVRRGWAGMECLSGIPGLTGATPIQNVGAYGQDVAGIITEVEALDTQTNTVVSFSAEECKFQYRGSRFKYNEPNRYIVTAVIFQLRPGAEPTIQYPQVLSAVEGGPVTLERVRSVVLNLRERKSMVYKPSDPHSHSCGSFFLNILLTPDEFAKFAERTNHSGVQEVPPSYPAGGRVKVPTAWVIEHAGFSRGERHGGVGISANHILALVNYGGTTQELLQLKNHIQETVNSRFGIQLTPEPVIVPLH